MKRERSAALFAQASQRMPGGVNSPVRSFAHVGEVPVFVKRAYGSRVEDEDGNVFIDYVGSWGPLILGHRPQCVVDAAGQWRPVPFSIRYVAFRSAICSLTAMG